MHTAYINIGSNQGDRRGHLLRAAARIGSTLGVGLRLSAVVESAPWGYDSPNPYLNVGVALATDLTPGRLLDALLAVERSLSAAPHRTPSGGYADRAIDIDLIACGQAVANDESTPGGNRLTLPHPRMHLRRFVLAPMAELLPDWRHPLLGLSPAEMLAALAANGLG